MTLNWDNKWYKPSLLWKEEHFRGLFLEAKDAAWEQHATDWCRGTIGLDECDACDDPLVVNVDDSWIGDIFLRKSYGGWCEEEKRSGETHELDAIDMQGDWGDDTFLHMWVASVKTTPN